MENLSEIDHSNDDIAIMNQETLKFHFNVIKSNITKLIEFVE